MAIEKTTKYKFFYKYQSTDYGLTWTKVEPEEVEYMAWEQNSIDCGYIPPIKPDSTGGTTGDTGTTTGSTTGDTGTTTGITTGGCETVVTYKDGTISGFSINGEISKGSIANISAATKVDIGTCATSVGEKAFSGGSSLSSVTIPNSVNDIGEWAFSECTNLSSVTIPNSVTSIGGYAFNGCDTLSSIKIPDSVTSIGEYAFGYCSGMTSASIGSGVTSIGGNAFTYCSGISSVTIPNSVTYVGEWAFSECSELSSVTIENSSNKLAYNDYAFYDISSTAKLYVPSNLLSDYQFDGAWVGAFKEGIWAIGDTGSTTGIATGGCETVVTYKDGTIRGLSINGQITNRSIGNKSLITDLNIGTCVTSIASSAFREWPILKSVTISDRVTSIGEGAFYICSGLTSVSIGSGVTNIGNGAFKYCKSLEKINFNGTMKQWDLIIKDDWIGSVPAKAVYCTDGYVKI